MTDDHLVADVRSDRRCTQEVVSLWGTKKNLFPVCKRDWKKTHMKKHDDT